MRKSSVVAALRSQRTATLHRLAQLPDRGWEEPCLPGRRVGDVVAHLVALDEALATGRLYRAVRRAEGRGDLEGWNEAGLPRWSQCSPAELLEALERWGDRLTRVVARMPSAVLRLPYRGWYGSQPLLFLLYRRVLDEWVHQCDIAWAAGPPTDRGQVGASPEVADGLAAAVLSSLPDLSLPRATATSGVVRLLVDTGEQQWRTWSVDFARRQYGKRVTARPDAVVRTHACTLALIAEGRWAWRGQLPGRLSVEGDRQIAAALLDVIPPPP